MSNIDRIIIAIETIALVAVCAAFICLAGIAGDALGSFIASL